MRAAWSAAVARLYVTKMPLIGLFPGLDLAYVINTDNPHSSYKIRLISKRVGRIIRIQGVRDSSEMLKNYKELKV